MPTTAFAAVAALAVVVFGKDHQAIFPIIMYIFN